MRETLRTQIWLSFIALVGLLTAPLVLAAVVLGLVTAPIVHAVASLLEDR
jgi:flagellar biosynthesis protein FliQ